MRTRRDFADFLDRLAGVRSTKAEWEAFCATRHDDEILENVRLRCVQISMGVSNWGELTPAEVQGFRILATELRAAEPTV